MFPDLEKNISLVDVGSLGYNYLCNLPFPGTFYFIDVGIGLDVADPLSGIYQIALLRRLCLLTVKVIVDLSLCRGGQGLYRGIILRGSRGFRARGSDSYYSLGISGH